ncbi:MAG: 1-deoxy-D-xylulose-5-phosphate synthase [Clostridia bacterium]|nr:1-deoxy-D-xylulose-5-phosphate synthase [Clostridia bacterium]
MINLRDIKEPKDLHNLTVKDLELLADQIRNFLIEKVSNTGGHLSSNLGVVELTLALHRVFDSPNDKLIWDVGHQGYVHKILTGRQDDFDTLRQHNGLSGFLKACESEHDIFEAGHSSTSISAALGFAKAMAYNHDPHKAIAIIGDGALTGGMAFEALNYIGHSNENIVVVLNDNEMSISDNVGAVSKHLNKIRTGKTYIHLKLKINKILRKIPIIGKPMMKFIGSFKDSLKKFLIKNMLFEEFGFHYVGVVDGHNLQKLVDVFEHVKELNGPVLVHVVTVKGKGYEPAEKHPEKYHGVSKFDPKIGIVEKPGKMKYQDVLGKQLIQLRDQHKEVVAITAAMPSGTGLSEFSQKYPESLIDVGIAEQNAVTMAGAMAKGGLKPYVCIYSTFLQRAYDQIVHDICIQNLNVTFCIDRAGLVGEDGETHHGMFDLSYLSHIPNMTVLAPKDQYEFEQMLIYSLTHEGPLAIRYPRGTAIHINDASLQNNTAEILRKGDDFLILAVGKMVEVGCEVVDSLKAKGINGTLINPRQIFPIKKELIPVIDEYEHVFTLEDNVIIGGYGAYLSTIMEQKIVPIGLSQRFIEHGNVDVLLEKEGLSLSGIENKILNELGK